MTKYTIKIINVHWSCGDGCCSDSWYTYKLFNTEKSELTCSYSDIEIRNKDYCLESAYEYALEYHNISDRSLIEVEYEDDWGNDD